MSGSVPPEPSAPQRPTVPSRRLLRLVGGYLVIGAGLAALLSLWLPWLRFSAPTRQSLPDDLPLPPPNYTPPPFVPAVTLRGSSAQVIALQLAPYVLLLACGLIQVIGRGRLRVLALAVLGFPLSFLGLFFSVYYAYWARTFATNSGIGLILTPKYVGVDIAIGAYLSGGSFIVALIGCRIAAAG